MTPTSPANDSGLPLTGVTTDRNGTKRPQGIGYDVGAYERVVASDVRYRFVIDTSSLR